MAASRNDIVVPQLFPVSEEDIEKLTLHRPIHPDLLAYWRDNGAGDFSRDKDGSRIHDCVNNRLLDAAEILELTEVVTYDIADITKFGMPIFNTLDREFIAIAPDGEIVEATPLGERRLVAVSLAEFIDRLLANPLFYEEHLSGDDLEADDVFCAKDWAD